MIEITVSPLQNVIRVYDTDRGESSDRKTRYSASMILTDLGMQECRLHCAHGNLTTEINQMIFEKIRELGYSLVQLEVPEGTTATRLGKKVKTADGLDRYLVEIK